MPSKTEEYNRANIFSHCNVLVTYFAGVVLNPTVQLTSSYGITPGHVVIALLAAQAVLMVYIFRISFGKLKQMIKESKAQVLREKKGLAIAQQSSKDLGGKSDISAGWWGCVASAQMAENPEARATIRSTSMGTSTTARVTLGALGAARRARAATAAAAAAATEPKRGAVKVVQQPQDRDKISSAISEQQDPTDLVAATDVECGATADAADADESLMNEIVKNVDAAAGSQ